MIMSFMVHKKVFKTSGYTLSFQHYLWDIVNVNKWELMFDSSIITMLKDMLVQNLSLALIETLKYTHGNKLGNT